MSEIPEPILRAMRASGVDVGKVEAALASGEELIPSDAELAAEQEAENDWRAQIPDETDDEDPQLALDVTGKYHGHDATETERISGTAVELDRTGPLRAGSLAHRTLDVYGNGERLTAYEASMRLAGDWHAKRREATRLLVRGYLVKQGTKPNEAPSGRPHVDAYVITDAGRAELARLGPVIE